MAERGVEVDHATLNRWVIKFSPLIAKEAHKRKRKTATSWRMDETYIRVKGKWTYYYRATDKFGKTLDFMLSKRRDEVAATANRSFPLPQGRVLGGSSSINGLNYVRGQSANYDNWAQMGNTGWSYGDVLPYFKRSERRIGPGDDAVRGRDGEMPITDLDLIHPVFG